MAIPEDTASRNSYSVLREKKDKINKNTIAIHGSSILEIYKSNADLSRRAVSYHLFGLSFREFLNFEANIELPVLSLDEIIENHHNIVSSIITKIKILPEFKKYLEYGYYPFYKEGLKSYSSRLHNVVNIILDILLK